jgi:hypothetical protein
LRLEFAERTTPPFEGEPFVDAGPYECLVHPRDLHVLLLGTASSFELLVELHRPHSPRTG